jgi:hypothetical protein
MITTVMIVINQAEEDDDNKRNDSYQSDSVIHKALCDNKGRADFISKFDDNLVSDLMKELDDSIECFLSSYNKLSSRKSFKCDFVCSLKL